MPARFGIASRGIALGAAVVFFLATGAWGEEVPKPTSPEKKETELAETSGGWQFWSDERIESGWRIQRHCWGGSCRLLDDRDLRHCEGDFETCRKRLEEIRREKALTPLDGKVVVTLHGLGRDRASMESLCKHLESSGKFKTVNVSYASTRGTLDDHAAALAKVVGGLEKAKEIHFVGHSMGNLVVRRMLADRADPRFGRVVMLGPPNRGSQVARSVSGIKAIAAVVGRSAVQLGPDWEKTAPLLATPAEFGVIAGGMADGVGFNPLIPGDDDLIVAVEETRLRGARDFRLVPLRHSSLLEDERVFKWTSSFLETGCFETDEKRQPIAGDPPKR